MPKTYVPNYKHDIFVSYAHVDNEPFPGVDKGWVTTLINGLKNFLGKKLGRADAYSLWMDYELRGNTEITPAIMEQLENAATLVLILSPGYLASQWCRLEFNVFLAKWGKNSGRVFVVEHDIVAERPNELRDLLGYRFWKHDDTGKPRILAIPKPNLEREPEYYQLLDDLARELTDKLKTLQEQSPLTLIPSTPPPLKKTITTPQTTVFLAEVTDDLFSRREEVKRYLLSQDIQVLPNKLYYFQTSSELEQAIDSDLTQSALFVQLLSSLCPQRPAGMSTPLLQYQRAQALKLPILQWRDRDLDIDTVTNASLHALLTSNTVMAIGLAEFQQRITHFLQKLTEKPPLVPNNTSDDTLVFINAAPPDMNLAYQIEQMLIQQGLGCSLPLADASQVSSAQIRQDLDNNLQSCDAVIVLDNVNTDDIWVRSQLFQCQRARGKREIPFKVIVVCQHPNKSSVNIRLPNLHTFECLPPFQNTCVSQFIEVL